MVVGIFDVLKKIWSIRINLMYIPRLFIVCRTNQLKNLKKVKHFQLFINTNKSSWYLYDYDIFNSSSILVPSHLNKIKC